MAVRQVEPQTRWPSGESRPIAVLAAEPTDLAARYGLVFEVDVDDLDRYRLAAIELDDGQQAWLLKHDSDPNAGTVVRVDGSGDVEQAQRSLARTLGLQPSEIIWTAPTAAGAAR